MRISQITLGWGLVALSAGVLIFLISGRWQSPTLPEGELRRMARTQIDWFVFEGEITHTESVIMRQDEFDAWRGVSQLAGYLEDGGIPIYVYRAYGNIKQALILGGFESPPDYYYQGLEVALDARTGKWLGIVSAIPHDVIPRDLKLIPTVDRNQPRFVPPTMVQLPSQPTALPEITAEALP